MRVAGGRRKERPRGRARWRPARPGAARVPLDIASSARRLLDTCERSLPDAAPATISDIGVGALMAAAALRGAAENVMINLASIESADRVRGLSEELDKALDGSEEQRDRVIQFVESRIAR